MASSTLPFEPPRPVRAATLLLTACATWLACILYTLFLNPEVRHYVAGARIKTAWSHQLTEHYGAKTVVFGGSSCEFSIDGERLLKQYQLPVANFGGHAGMGPAVMAEFALGELQAGDTLIVALEPGLLTGSAGQTSLGIQFSTALHQPQWVLHPALGVGTENWIQVLTALRPGGYHTFTLLGKLATRQPLYRYQLRDYRASGWAQTDARYPFNGPDCYEAQLSPRGRVLLEQLAAWCRRHNVRVAYSLPWSYSAPEQVVKFKKLNTAFLAQVATILPVLRDPKLGADSDRNHFADTAFHLNETGAGLRCADLARVLKLWEVWSPNELQDLCPGNPD
jgi:hypothetical protein